MPSWRMRRSGGGESMRLFLCDGFIEAEDDAGQVGPGGEIGRVERVVVRGLADGEEF